MEIMQDKLAIHKALIKFSRNLLLIVSMLSVIGCSSMTTGELPQDGPKMREVYETHDSGINSVDDARAEIGNRTGRHIYNEDTDLAGYTRHANNEINQLFPKLSNPTLIMFIDPHLSEVGAPIPGYSTAFPMYETYQYALPGEKFQ